MIGGTFSNYRRISIFLKMGHISLKCSRKLSGTWISHSTQPNSLLFFTALMMDCVVMVFTLSRGRRRWVAMNRCSALFRFFISRHSHFPTLDKVITLFTNISTVSFCLFKQFFHGFISLLVHFFPLVKLAVMAMPIAS